MKRFGALIGCLAALAAGGGDVQAAPAPRLQAVEASLAQGNPQATLAKFFDCQAFRGTAYERIASGAAPWVAMAQRMLEHSDACYTEGILSALGQAMVRAPQRVLPLVQTTPTLAADKICLPFISDELPRARQRALVARSRQAIGRVRGEALALPRAACLDFIKSVEATLKADPAAPPK